LKSLRAQSLIDRMEILLLDFGTRDHPPVAGSEHAAVRVIPVKRTLGYGGALTIAVNEVRAPLVAFVEEHVVVLDGWAQALVDAHKSPCAAVCGEVRPGDLERPVAQRIEMVSRHRWSPPAQRGESDVLRWQNVCYKRASLLRYGDKLPLYLSSESILFRRLREDGERLLIEPGARIIHDHELTWRGFLRGSFHSARLSAARGVEARELGMFGRLTQTARHLLGAARWPIVLWQRTRSLPDSEQWLPIFYRNLPFVFQYYSVHAVGGFLGVLAGSADSDREFLVYELNEGRYEKTSRPSPTK
jgi:GT2 family glycosyltransferase